MRRRSRILVAWWCDVLALACVATAVAAVVSLVLPAW